MQPLLKAVHVLFHLVLHLVLRLLLLLLQALDHILVLSLADLLRQLVLSALLQIPIVKVDVHSHFGLRTSTQSHTFIASTNGGCFGYSTACACSIFLSSSCFVYPSFTAFVSGWHVFSFIVFRGMLVRQSDDRISFVCRSIGLHYADPYFVVRYMIDPSNS